MTIIAIAAVGVVVGLVAHLILGADGYSWFGEIVLGLAGAFLFGLIAGILSGARDLNAEVVIAALLGSAIVEAIAILVTFRAVGRRGFGRAAQ